MRKGLVGVDAANRDAETIRAVREILLVRENVTLCVVAPQEVRSHGFLLTTVLNASGRVGEAHIDQRRRFIAQIGAQIVREQTLRASVFERPDVRFRRRVPYLRPRALRHCETERKVVEKLPAA